MEHEKKIFIFHEETCVACGAPVPEGTQVCAACMAGVGEDNTAHVDNVKKVETMSTWDAHLKWGVTKRYAAKLCETGRIPGAYKIRETWYIPADAQRPPDGRKKKWRNRER